MYVLRRRRGRGRGSEEGQGVGTYANGKHGLGIDLVSGFSRSSEVLAGDLEQDKDGVEDQEDYDASVLMPRHSFPFATGYATQVDGRQCTHQQAST